MTCDTIMRALRVNVVCGSRTGLLSGTVNISHRLTVLCRTQAIVSRAGEASWLAVSHLWWGAHPGASFRTLLQWLRIEKDRICKMAMRHRRNKFHLSHKMSMFLESLSAQRNSTFYFHIEQNVCWQSFCQWLWKKWLALFVTVGLADGNSDTEYWCTQL